MARELIRTAKELSWKAYLDAFKTIGTVINEPLIRERFENWWGQNYENLGDTTNFVPELSVFIEGKRYIKAD